MCYYTLEIVPQQINSNPVCVAVDVIQRLMDEKGFAFCKGRIFKKKSGSMHTYAYHSSVEDFLMASLSNPELANVLTMHVHYVSKLLSNPTCGLVKQLKIDYNLIEVLPAGTCFHIGAKNFQYHRSMQKGLSPRAFIEYEYDENKLPNPKPFIEG